MIPQSSLQIGEWQLDARTHRLSRGTESHRLPRLQFELLRCLCAHAGQLVSRDTLIERVWQRKVVSDEVLSRQVATLRHLLGDDARAPRYLETIPKAGYRLLAAVSEMTAANEDSASDPSPAMPPADTRARWHNLLIIGSLLLLAGVVISTSMANRDRAIAPPLRWTAAIMANQIPLASDPELEMAPRISRDGRWLAYARVSAEGEYALWLARADGGGPQLLTPVGGSITGVAFAPDATELAFVEHAHKRCSVRTFALPAGPLRTLAACAAGRGLDWSPDGRAIVFTAAEVNADGAHPLMTLTPASGISRQLTTPGANDAADTEPRFSPDGSQLAFARGSNGMQQLMLASADGSATRIAEPQDRATVSGLAWSVDGRQLVVATDTAGYPALQALNLSDSSSVLLGARGATALDIGPDGSLIFEQRNYDANIWLQALDATSVPRQLSRSSRFDAQPALAPDGQRFAYVSNRDAVGSIWIADLDGGEERLPLDTAGIWNRPSWSPDGSQLLLTHYVDGHQVIAQHDLASGRTTIISMPNVVAGDATYAGDGSIVFARRVGDVAQLFRSVGDAAPQRIAGSESVTEFRAGVRFVAWQNAQKAGVTIRSLDGRDVAGPEWLLETPTYAWAFAGDLLVVQRVEADGVIALWSFDPMRNESRRVGSMPAATAVGPNLSVDAELNHALFARIDALEADLLRVAPTQIAP